MATLRQKLRAIRSRERPSIRTLNEPSVSIIPPPPGVAAARRLVEILQHQDWKDRITALPEPEYTRLIQAKNLTFLQHGRGISDRQSKASWLDMMGSAVSQRSLHRR